MVKRSKMKGRILIGSLKGPNFARIIANCFFKTLHKKAVCC